MGWLFLFFLVLIVCSTILLGMYMYYCSENKTNMFADRKCNERIKELEKAVLELQNRQKENK